MQHHKNVPYVKVMDGNKITNPITKDNPYLHPFKSREKPKKPRNNKKGVRLLIVNYGFGKIYKHYVFDQIISTKSGNKTITHYVDANPKKYIN